MSTAIQYVIDAVSSGGLYALLALGIAVTFGVARIVNFAQGQLIMITAYLVLALDGLAAPLVIVLVLIGVVLVALGMERAYRPLRGADETTLLIASFFLGVFVQNVVVAIAGNRTKSVDFMSGLAEAVTVGSLRIGKLDIAVIVLAIALLIGFGIFLRGTRLGIQLRGTAEDAEMSRLLGVRSTRIIQFAFAVGGVTAAMAGFVTTISTGTLTPSMGLQPLLIGLTAAVIGGLGSLRGAAVGGFVLGAGQVALQALLPNSIQPYTSGILYALVIVVLLVRPRGLFAPAMVERV